MSSLEREIDQIAEETRFSGVVRVDRDSTIELAKAYGLAHRGESLPNTVDTRFGMASGSKTFTALATMALVEDGVLSLDTTARSLLGADLPLIDDAVTIEHLLGHRSGIGDYIDENSDDLDITDYVLTAPVNELVTTEDFLAVLGGHETEFTPGDRFSYCNGGYVVLALLVERASGTPYHDLIRQRVTGPAGMTNSEFFRSDELPGGVALGYLFNDGRDRTNVFHLPVRATGDGGCYTTVADMRSFWTSLFSGRIVSEQTVAEMTRAHSDDVEPGFDYGLGFWLKSDGPGGSSGAVQLEGMDAGVSFRSVHNPATDLTHTVISNDTYGAWPIARRVIALLES
jgi:CubicO group peptidase (beta-lactamase class C family)